MAGDAAAAGEEAPAPLRDAFDACGAGAAWGDFAAYCDAAGVPLASLKAFSVEDIDDVANEFFSSRKCGALVKGAAKVQLRQWAAASRPKPAAAAPPLLQHPPPAAGRWGGAAAQPAVGMMPPSALVGAAIATAPVVYPAAGRGGQFAHIAPVPAALTRPAIEALVLRRQHAKAARDYATSDAIERQLKDGGVETHDKERRWEAADGSGGEIPFIASLQPDWRCECGWVNRGNYDQCGGKREDFGCKAVRPGSVLPAAQLGQLGWSSGVEGIPTAATWAGSDETATVAWPAAKRPRGGATPVPDYSPVADAPVDIEALVQQRQVAKSQRDYALADQMELQLKAAGVTVDDRARAWYGADGRSGTVPFVESGGVKWPCACGFVNRPENAICGGRRGDLGCKQPRPHT